MRDFRELLGRRMAAMRFVCLGLDVRPEFLPDSAMDDDGDRAVARFNGAAVEAANGIPGAIKLNSAFYEARGSKGWDVMKHCVSYIQTAFPQVIVIVDGKRGDIGKTSEAYAAAMFDDLHADAITVSPYMGYEALKPLLARPEKGVFVVCRTSGPGSDEFQRLPVGPSEMLFERVARNVADVWNVNGNCGLVAGATATGDIKRIREIVGDDVPLLIPGVGTQQGNLEEAVKNAVNRRKEGFLVNSSSGITFASKGPDYAAAIYEKTQELHDAINKCLLSL